MSDRPSTLYQDVLTGRYDCVDRILLNGYFGLCHSAGGFRLWWRQLTGNDQTLDSETACAYEFKVSGKNAWAEFYKDVVKVLMWSEHRKKKLSCLTFITEEKYGKPLLDAPMTRAYIRFLAEHGLKVSIEYVRHT